jgi:hypothetical protein
LTAGDSSLQAKEFLRLWISVIDIWCFDMKAAILYCAVNHGTISYVDPEKHLLLNAGGQIPSLLHGINFQGVPFGIVFLENYPP